MKISGSLSAVMLAMLFCTATVAAEPADRVIENAKSDILRFEQQAQDLTPERASSARRILKLMALSHERLQTSSKRSDPSWKEVNQRYVDLTVRLEGLLNPDQTPPSEPAPDSSPQATAPATARPATEGDGVPELVSGQRVQVKKLLRDIQGVSDSMVTTGPSPLQDPDVVAARQQRLEQLKEALGRYPQVDDPDVLAARNAYEALRQKLSAEFKRARKQLTQLGDVQQRLATIEENSRTYAVPQALALPFTEADAKAWVASASNARTVAEHNQKELAGIAPLAYLPNNPGTPQGGAPYDAKDVDRLQRMASGMLTSVAEHYQAMATEIDNRFIQIENDVLTRWQEDPRGDKKWLFIAEGKQEEAETVFADSLAVANSALHLEQALGRETAKARQLIGQIEQAKTAFATNRQIALEASRLPQAKSSDKQLLAIAEQILTKPKYEFGEFRSIVLTTAGTTKRELKSSEVDIDDVELTLAGDVKLSGTETTWTYKWEEFKFAVALKEAESGQWYIWWITAKNFSSGGDKTPLNQWVSGKATKGNQILEKNLTP